MLEKEVHIERGITAQYNTAYILMLLILSVLAGAKHISQVAILRHGHAAGDEVLKSVPQLFIKEL